jgi:hypothetical protein
VSLCEWLEIHLCRIITFRIVAPVREAYAGSLANVLTNLAVRTDKGFWDILFIKGSVFLKTVLAIDCYHVTLL